MFELAGEWPPSQTAPGQTPAPSGWRWPLLASGGSWTGWRRSTTTPQSMSQRMECPIGEKHTSTTLQGSTTSAVTSTRHSKVWWAYPFPYVCLLLLETSNVCSWYCTHESQMRKVRLLPPFVFKPFWGAANRFFLPTLKFSKQNPVAWCSWTRVPGLPFSVWASSVHIPEEQRPPVDSLGRAQEEWAGQIVLSFVPQAEVWDPYSSAEPPGMGLGQGNVSNGE